MKFRPTVIVIIICVLGVAVSATTYLIGQNRAGEVFAGELDVAALQRLNERGESFIVYFYGRSCEDCAKSEPYLLEAIAETRGRGQLDAEVYKCEREANATVRSLYGVEGTPTLIWFNQGQEYKRQDGALPDTDEYVLFFIN